MKKYALALLLCAACGSPEAPDLVVEPEGPPANIQFDASPDGINVKSAYGTTRALTPQEAGRIMAYPGVGTDNLAFRTQIAGECVIGGGYTLDTSGVMARMHLKGSRVVKGAVTPQVVNTHTCSNRSSETVSCTVSHTETVTNSWQSGWSRSTSINVSATIGFRLGSSAAFASEDQHVTVGWSGTVGEAYSHTETVSLAEGFSATFPVPPGQVVEAVMQIDKAQATYELAYDVDVSGTVAITCDYPGSTDGSKHFSIPIKTLYDGTHPRVRPNSAWPQTETWYAVRQLSALAFTQTVTYDASFNARTDFNQR